MGTRTRPEIQRGLWLAVFGPDGAGKSAAIKRLACDGSLPFQEIRQFHFRPMFRRQEKNSPPVIDPHAKPPRSSLVSAFKLLYWLADCWFGYLVTIRPARRSSRLVVYDRYLDDILIDPRRYRLPESSLWFAKLVVRLAPRPDLYVLLDVPSEIVQQRKAEVLPAESLRQRLAYLEMFGHLPNAFVVNAVSPVDKVAEELKATILKSLSDPPVDRAEVSPTPSADLAQRVFAPLVEDRVGASCNPGIPRGPGEGNAALALAGAASQGGSGLGVLVALSLEIASKMGRDPRCSSCRTPVGSSWCHEGELFPESRTSIGAP